MLATGSCLQSQQRCLTYLEPHCSSSSVSETPTKNLRIGLNYHVQGSLWSEYVPRRNLVQQGLVHGRRAGLRFTQDCSTSGAVGLFPKSDSSNGAVAIPSLSSEEPLECLDSEERLGVLLLNLGGPEKLEDVGPFLYNLFADPDIIRLPRLFRFLQKPLAKLISTLRAPKSSVGYAAIGGGSPLRRITDEQAVALKKELESKGLSARVYVGMRYWYPFTEEAIEKVKADQITRLVILPLYPQFSISTSGSSLRLLETIFRNDEYLSNMKHTVIPSWYHRRGYLKSMSTLIRRELLKFDNPQEVRIFFSAHGVPVSYVENAGDPYKSEMEECVDFIMDELRHEGVNCERTLAYQSRVGPIEWLKPYTDETIKELGKQGTESLLVVPISFVSEHIETLEEIDMEYKELALESGIKNWHRVPALGCEPTFIADLADAVIESLPFVGPLTPSSEQVFVTDSKEELRQSWKSR